MPISEFRQSRVTTIILRVKRLGSGAFGDVYKGILRSGLMDRKEVAIKTISGSISAEENEKLFQVHHHYHISNQKSALRSKLQEAMLMKTLVHPNVILLIGVASNEEPVMIVMELAPGSSLHLHSSIPSVIINILSLLF